MNKPKLSNETKMLIQKYLIKRLMVIATAASIISFLLGFFIKDIAKAEAYNKAYSEAAQTIMQITSEATESANKIKNLEDQVSKLTGAVNGKNTKIFHGIWQKRKSFELCQPNLSIIKTQ